MAAHPHRHCHAFKLLRASGQIPEAMRTGSPLARHQVDRRILSSSIDLDIEFKTIAFSQLFHSGILDRTNVDERIRLTIVAGDKSEALHAVEELDRSGSPFSGQFTLRGCLTLLHRDNFPDRDKVTGRNLAATVNKGEFQILPLGQAFKTSPLDSTDMDEHVFAAIILLDESEALVRVKELHRAFALADDLGRHAAAPRSTAETTAAAGTTRAAAETATAAEATTPAAAAEAITATESATVTATKTVAATSEWIERVLSESVSLVAPPAATTSVKTHKTQNTLLFAQPNLSWRRGRNPPDNDHTTRHAYRWFDVQHAA